MKRLYVAIAIIASAYAVNAEEQDKWSFSIGGELVSSYVWREMYQTGTSIQPFMEAGTGNFALSVWGSVDVANTGFKEVDFTASYSLAGIRLSATDYWWVGEGVYDYFVYKSRDTGHVFEASLSYTLPLKNAPLSFSWNTFFAGADYYKANGDRAYSSYAELNYPFQAKNILLEASISAAPWSGMYADGFSVVGISLKAEKLLKFSESFSLPIFCRLIANPRNEDTFFVAGIRF